MPEGNAPSQEIKLDYIPNKDGQWGGYGPVMFERTRLGLDNLLYVQGANRGDLVSVIGIHYVSSLTEAIQHIKDTEAQQGNEVNLISALDGWQKMVFVQRIQGARRPIGSTTITIDGVQKTVAYRIIYNIQMQRTN